MEGPRRDRGDGASATLSRPRGNRRGSVRFDGGRHSRNRPTEPARHPGAIPRPILAEETESHFQYPEAWPAYVRIRVRTAKMVAERSATAR